MLLNRFALIFGHCMYTVTLSLICHFTVDVTWHYEGHPKIKDTTLVGGEGKSLL